MASLARFILILILVLIVIVIVIDVVVDYDDETPPHSTLVKGGMGGLRSEKVIMSADVDYD
jgi:ribose 5-phosphate isomerase